MVAPEGPHAIKLIGPIGLTLGQTLIFGPFETDMQKHDSIFAELGCSNPNASVPGGIDTHTAEQHIAEVCGIDLPQSDPWVGLLDECGGHRDQYHYHERASCLYNRSSPGHSELIGFADDDTPIYGMYETTHVTPVLDACGAHFGITPDSAGSRVYHYHVQDKPPFFLGCYGPNDDGDEVALSECWSYYPESCGDGLVDVALPNRVVAYDPWCPCFDHRGLNSDAPNQSVVPAPTAPLDVAMGSLVLHGLTLDQVAQQERTVATAIADVARVATPTVSIDVSTPTDTNSYNPRLNVAVEYSITVADFWRVQSELIHTSDVDVECALQAASSFFDNVTVLDFRVRCALDDPRVPIDDVAVPGDSSSSSNDRWQVAIVVTFFVVGVLVILTTAAVLFGRRKSDNEPDKIPSAPPLGSPPCSPL